jgi:pyruvate/2-oxoglutarate dehydrogenase complex dihydrolipoamide acyltransferase (E2) component
MATDVVVPEVGELGMEVTLIRWLKLPGEAVEVGDVLFELDTDKTVVEVEAWAAGTLTDVRAAAGDTVAPRQVVARIVAIGEAAGGSSAAPGPIPTTPIRAAGAAASSAAPAAPSIRATDAAGGVVVRASPRARALARELGTDLTTLAGSGPDGLITERDVLAAGGETPEAR